MSEIYDALKRISGSKQSHQPEESQKKISGNVIVFRQFFRSPAGLLILVLIIFAFLGLCSLGAYLLLDSLAPPIKTETPTALQLQEPIPFPEPSTEPEVPSPGSTVTQIEDIPELNENEITFTEVDEPSPTVAHLSFNKEDSAPYTAKGDRNTSSSSSSQKATASVRTPATTPPAHIPATPSDNQQQIVLSHTDTVTSGSPVDYPEEGSSLAEISQPTSRPTEINRLSLSEQTPPATKFQPESNTVNGIQKATSFPHENWKNSVESTAKNFARAQYDFDQQAPKSAEEILQKKQTPSHYEVAGAQSVLNAPPQEARATAGPNDILAQRNEKGAKITLLVAQLEQMIYLGKTAEAEKFLQEIENSLGKNSIYLLKMKSFFHMKQHQNEQAASFLQQVLARDENDLEAGINMAVLEIMANKREAATRRLQRLNDVYPGNFDIQRLLEKIR